MSILSRLRSTCFYGPTENRGDTWWTPLSLRSARWKSGGTKMMDRREQERHGARMGLQEATASTGGNKGRLDGPARRGIGPRSELGESVAMEPLRAAKRTSTESPSEGGTMNRQELARRLTSEGFLSDLYSLDGGFPALLEGFILKTTGARWTVEYYERGTTRTLAEYPTEGEACEFLYETLKADPTTRRR
jgi:hypothetical protein